MRRTIVVASLLFALPLFATEPNPTPRQHELIQQLMKLTNANSAGKSMMDSMFEQMEKQMTAGAQGEDASEAKELFAAFRARVAKLDLESLLGDAQVRIYAKYFNEKELTDLIAFYGTPSGRKSIEVMPQLMRECMEAGVQYVSPKIQEAMLAAQEDVEQKRPWRRTMSDIRSVASALVAYASDHEEHYPTGDYASLEETLKEYLEKFPQKDMWGHAYAYVVSPDAKHFRLVSSGSDGIFEWDSRRIAASPSDAAIRYRDRLEDDLIFADEAFVQLPVQAKGKNE